MWSAWDVHWPGGVCVHSYNFVCVCKACVCIDVHMHEGRRESGATVLLSYYLLVLLLEIHCVVLIHTKTT